MVQGAYHSLVRVARDHQANTSLAEYRVELLIGFQGSSIVAGINSRLIVFAGAVAKKQGAERRLKFARGGECFQKLY